jgi:PIN domain nuclease of toxin-antitoxin system
LKNENDVNKHYVLDTSAYFTLFEDEEGSDTVQNILEQAKVGDAIVFTSFVSFILRFFTLHSGRKTKIALLTESI